MLGTRREPLNFSEFARQQASAAESILLEKCELSIGLLEAVDKTDQALIRQVLATIISGQELDLTRFADATAAAPIPLETDAELDDYTFRVAGCVGEFWTRICCRHIFQDANVNESPLLAYGVRFGKGLQLINILRDLPADLRKGRCYIPRDALQRVGLRPGDLLVPANEGRFRPVYDVLLDRAESHLAAGWDYTNAIPWKYFRVRLACALPILIGSQTVDLLRRGAVLNPENRIKIPRSQVKALFRKAVLLYPFAGKWKDLARFKASSAVLDPHPAERSAPPGV
jgi:farnesyl-diphosphate farnesyltransferase